MPAHCGGLNKGKVIFMKKLLLALLILTLTFSLCGCKSEAAKEVDAMIAAIGEVTLESKAAIDEIDAKVEALEEKDKKALDNIAMLDEAKEAYSTLIVAEAQKKIDAIDKVTLKSEDAIKEAREYLDSLPAKEKGMVSAFKLEQAEKDFMQLKADKVIKLIKEIGTVTLDSSKKIKKAEEAFSDLSREEQLLVSNYNDLTSARAKYNQLKKARQEEKGKAALSTMKKEYDKVEQITWYDNFPRYIDIRSYMLPYIGVKNGVPWMNVRYNYTGDSWIFWKSLTIVVDGEKYTETPSYYEIIHDNDTEVWEYIDLKADIEMLEAVAKSKETIVRFQGDNYHYDLTVSSADKKIIKNMLTAYEYLENK